MPRHRGRRRGPSGASPVMRARVWAHRKRRCLQFYVKSCCRGFPARSSETWCTGKRTRVMTYPNARRTVTRACPRLTAFLMLCSSVTAGSVASPCRRASRGRAHRAETSARGSARDDKEAPTFVCASSRRGLMAGAVVAHLEFVNQNFGTYGKGGYVCF